MPTIKPEGERSFRKGPGGRPTKLTDAVTLTVCNYLLDGAYIETAAAAAGINKATLHAWLRQAAADDEADLVDTPHQKFRQSVEEAIAESESRDLARITDAAAKGNWHAAAWRLERRFPRRWAPTKRFVEDDDAEASAFRFNYSFGDDEETA